MCLKVHTGSNLAFGHASYSTLQTPRASRSSIRLSEHHFSRNGSVLRAENPRKWKRWRRWVSSSADQVLRYKCSPTVRQTVPETDWSFGTDANRQRRVPKSSYRKVTEGQIACFFWQLRAVFDQPKFEQFGTLNFILLLCESQTTRLWVIDGLLINYYRHISTITILFLFFCYLNSLCVTFAVTNGDSCKNRNVSFCFFSENHFRVCFCCVCVCLS